MPDFLLVGRGKLIKMEKDIDFKSADAILLLTRRLSVCYSIILCIVTPLCKQIFSRVLNSYNALQHLLFLLDLWGEGFNILLCTSLNNSDSSPLIHHIKSSTGLPPLSSSHAPLNFLFIEPNVLDVRSKHMLTICLHGVLWFPRVIMEVYKKQLSLKTSWIMIQWCNAMIQSRSLDL